MTPRVLDDLGYRPVRTWITLSMYTCVAAIIIGLLIPSNLAYVKIAIPHAMFLFAFLSQYLMAFIYPDDKPNEKLRKNVCITVFLIWMFFPIVAAMNAWGFAIGMYNPIQDDGYPHSIGHWWTLIVSQIAIGIVTTTMYFRKSGLLANNGWSPRYIWASWGTQLIALLAYRLGPTW